METDLWHCSFVNAQKWQKSAAPKGRNWPIMCLVRGCCQVVCTRNSYIYIFCREKFKHVLHISHVMNLIRSMNLIYATYFNISEFRESHAWSYVAYIHKFHELSYIRIEWRAKRQCCWRGAVYYQTSWRYPR